MVRTRFPSSRIFAINSSTIRLTTRSISGRTAAFWSALPAGAVILTGFMLAGGAAAAGWTSYPPLSAIIQNGWATIGFHGDFLRINARGGCFVLGRSDATLNRHGVRIGTAEVYRSLLGVPAVEDSLIVNLDLPGGKFFMPLFVKTKNDVVLDDTIADQIRAQIRREYSPRHVPDKIFQVHAIPYTLTGKKMEVPVRRILMGVPAEKAANRAAMADVHSLDYFVEYARTQRDYSI